MSRQSEKKLVKQQYLLHMFSQYGERLRSLGEFGVPQQISTGFASWLRYYTDVAQRRSTKLCTVFGRLLGCYIFFFGGGGSAKFTLHQSCVLLYWQRYCMALEHSASARVQRGTRNGITELSLLDSLCRFQQRSPPIFRGRPSRWAYAF